MKKIDEALLLTAEAFRAGAALTDMAMHMYRCMTDDEVRDALNGLDNLAQKTAGYTAALAGYEKAPAPEDAGTDAEVKSLHVDYTPAAEKPEARSAFSAAERDLLNIAGYLLKLSKDMGMSLEVKINMVNPERPRAAIGVMEPGRDPERYTSCVSTEFAEGGFLEKWQKIIRRRRDELAGEYGGNK